MFQQLLIVLVFKNSSQCAVACLSSIDCQLSSQHFQKGTEHHIKIHTYQLCLLAFLPRRSCKCTRCRNRSLDEFFECESMGFRKVLIKCDERRGEVGEGRGHLEFKVVRNVLRSGLQFLRVLEISDECVSINGRNQRDNVKQLIWRVSGNNEYFSRCVSAA